MNSQMPRTKYFFNPKSLSFEKVSDHRGYMRWRIIGLSSLIVVSVISLSLLFSRFMKTPMEQSIARENNIIQKQLSQMERQVSELENQLGELQNRDVEIYRAMYGVEPPKPFNYHGDDYQELLSFSHGKFVKRLREKLDQLNQKATLQDKSYDLLSKLITKREDMVNAIPAIMPVANKDLRKLASGFGYRMDPFYHTASFHAGMDFTADVGTEVYATGNGVVSEVKNEAWGYGNHIIVNHGFGYTTLYGHLSRFAVRPGTKVKRGQLIGYVGSTGRSTGPHLHYEVRRYKNPLNPAFFYRNDLSDAEYQRMLEMSQREANRFD